MSATLIGVIYSTASNVALRTVIPDDTMGDAYLQSVVLRPGEAMVAVPKSALPPIANDPIGHNCRLDATMPVIAAAGGPKLTRGIPHNIVDGAGKVVGTIVACPVLAKAPVGHTLVRA